MARRTIKQRIALDGGKQIKRELEEFGEVGERVFNELQAAANKLDGVGDKFVASMQRAQKALENTGKRIRDVGRSFQNVGRSLTTFVTAPIVAGLGAAAKASIDFESAMADVRKVVDFDSPEAFEQMGRDIEELSLRIPIAAEGLAAIAAAAGQAGIEAEGLTEFTELVAKASVAFELTAEEAGSALAKIKTALSLSTPEVELLSDAMNQLANNAAASEADILEVVNRVAALGNVSGVSANEVAAIGSAMVSMGVDSERAATGLRNILLRMQAGETATKAQQEAWAQLGLEATQVAKDLQERGVAAILDVFERINKQAPEVRSSIVNTLFGQRVVDAALPLIANLDELRRQLGLVADEAVFAGSTAREFAVRNETAATQIQLFNNSITNLRRAIGDELLPSITDFIDRARVIIDAFSKLDPAVKKTIINFGLLAAVVGPVVLAFGLFLSGIGLIVTGAGKLIGVFSGLFVAGRAILGVFTGLGGVLARIFTLSGGFLGVIARGAVLAATAIAGLASAPALVVAALIAAGVAIFVFWDEIVAGGRAAYEWLTNFFSPENFSRLLDGLAEAGEIAGEALVKALEIAAKAAVAALRAQFSLLTGFMQGVTEGIASRVSDAFTSLAAFARTTFANLQQIADQFVAAIGPTFTALGTTISNIWTPLSAAATRVFDGVVGAAGFLIDRVVGIFTAGVARVRQAFGLIADVVTSVWSTASDGVRAAADAILESIRRATEIADDIKGAEQLARALVRPFIEARDQINQIINGLRGLVDQGFAAIASGVDAAAARIKVAIAQIIADLRRAVEQARRLAAEARSARSSSGDGDGAFARGGYIRGPGTSTSDSIPAWLSAGEFVIRAQAVRHYGPGLMRALNSMSLTRDKLMDIFGRKFRAGGLVESPVRFPSMRDAFRNISDGLAFPMPALTLANGGEVPAARMSGRPINITLPSGETFEMVADESVAKKLERFATNSGTRSAGRKPGWYGR